MIFNRVVQSMRSNTGLMSPLPNSLLGADLKYVGGTLLVKCGALPCLRVCSPRIFLVGQGITMPLESTRDVKRRRLHGTRDRRRLLPLVIPHAVGIFSQYFIRGMVLSGKLFRVI